MPAAGWYDDPSDAALRRFWDGQTWTTHTRPKDRTAPPPTTATMPPPQPAGAVAVAAPPALAYVPPAPAAAGKPNPALVIAGAVGGLVVFAGLAAFFLSGSGYGPSDLEVDLYAAVQADTGSDTPLAVDCSQAPDPIENGATATCFVTEQDGATGTVAIEMLDGGMFEWELVASSIHGPSLAAQIATELTAAAGVAVEVDCPSFAESVPGATFTCVASDTLGNVADVDVTVADRFGGVDWLLSVD